MLTDHDRYMLLHYNLKLADWGANDLLLVQKD